MKYKFVCFFVVAFTVINFAQVKLQLASLFADNMVLQQKTNAAVWGKARPDSKIEINAGWGSRANTIALKDSTWKIYINTPEAGGPYNIVIKENNQEIKLNNVLVGEVWVCSGQSNMEMPLEGWPPKDTIVNSAVEISNANYPKIRLFSTKTIASPDVKQDCAGTWQVCSSAAAAKFSAVGYFFGRKLFNELKTPIGLIYSGWGGTTAEAWTKKSYLADFPEFRKILAEIDENIPSVVNQRNWLQKFPSIEVNDYNRNDLWNFIDLRDSCYSKPEFDFSDWQVMELPVNWEKTELGEFNGFIWFKKNIQIPESWIGSDLSIELGAIDDYDVTYVNGVKIGSTEKLRKWKENRIYKISPDINNSRILSIAVRVHDSGGTGGGIYGGGFIMRLIKTKTKEEIPLAGKWNYLPVAELFEMKYYVFTDNTDELKFRPRVGFFYNQRTPSALYNGMIAPLTPYAIKGVIWYQGESNAENPEQYERLFPAMIKNWRESWGYEFPFYFAQIAPYKHGKGIQSQFLRDAQRKALSLPNTGMAVILDVGDSTTVHPANKRPVGERLALQALANQYGKAVVFSGPLYKSCEIINNRIELQFEHTGSGLELRECEKGNLFQISGRDKVFKAAKIQILKDKIIVWSDEIQNPVAVSYAWDNYTTATLFNKEGLPASSFRSDK